MWQLYHSLFKNYLYSKNQVVASRSDIFKKIILAAIYPENSSYILDVSKYSNQLPLPLDTRIIGKNQSINSMASITLQKYVDLFDLKEKTNTTCNIAVSISESKLILDGIK